MTTLYVKDLHENVNEDEIEKIFTKYGRLTSFRVYYPQNSSPMAYIEYEDENSAGKAMEQLNGAKRSGISNRLLQIERMGTNHNQKQHSQYKIWIRNLSVDTTLEELKDILTRGGDLVHIEILDTGDGVASFATYNEMIQAIEEFNGYRLHGECMQLQQHHGALRVGR